MGFCHIQGEKNYLLFLSGPVSRQIIARGLNIEQMGTQESWGGLLAREKKQEARTRRTRTRSGTS